VGDAIQSAQGNAPVRCAQEIPAELLELVHYLGVRELGSTLRDRRRKGHRPRSSKRGEGMGGSADGARSTAASGRVHADGQHTRVWAGTVSLEIRPVARRRLGRLEVREREPPESGDRGTGRGAYAVPCRPAGRGNGSPPSCYRPRTWARRRRWLQQQTRQTHTWSRG